LVEEGNDGFSGSPTFFLKILDLFTGPVTEIGLRDNADAVFPAILQYHRNRLALFLFTQRLGNFPC
jgi:hypothetical protein